jgi:hypothetical protein
VSDIFLSYAREDLPRVKPVVDALEARGWSVWWDRTIPPGKTWDEVIETALSEARCVIVLWSRDSVQSDWVRTEADEGKHRGILVPALLDTVNIPLAFKRIQAANLVDWQGKLPHAGFDEFARAVEGVLAGAASKRTGASASVHGVADPVVRFLSKRCWGLTRNLRRCGRQGDWKLFCADHRRQPFVWLFVLVFTVLAGAASIQSAWFKHQPAPLDSRFSFKEEPSIRILHGNKELDKQIVDTGGRTSVLNGLIVPAFQVKTNKTTTITGIRLYLAEGDGRWDGPCLPPRVTKLSFQPNSIVEDLR